MSTTQFTLEKCLYPLCTKPRHSRGLCCSHYTTTARLVRSGKVTWQELEKQGRASMPQPQGRKSARTPFLNWLLEGKQDAPKVEKVLTASKAEKKS